MYDQRGSAYSGKVSGLPITHQRIARMYWRAGPRALDQEPMLKEDGVEITNAPPRSPRFYMDPHHALADISEDVLNAEALLRC